MNIQPNIITKVIYADEVMPNGKNAIDSFFCCDLVTMTVRYYSYDDVSDVRTTVFMNKVSLKEAVTALFYQELMKHYG